MSVSTRKELEILIHTAAPSRGPDDARYRALAQAYLSFQPVRRLEVCKQPSIVEGDDDKHAGSQLQEELILSTQERPGSESYRPEEQESHSTQYSTQCAVEEEPRTQDIQDDSAAEGSRYFLQHRDLSRTMMESPQLSFDSVLHNADSPVFHGLENTTMVVNSSDGLEPENQALDQANSWRPPPSVVEDSQPEHNKSTALFSSPTRVLELYLRHFKPLKEPKPSEIRRSGRLAAQRTESSLAGSGLSQKTYASKPAEVTSQRPGTSDTEGSNANQWSLPMSLPSSTDSVEIGSNSSIISGMPSSPLGGAQIRTSERKLRNQSQSLHVLGTPVDIPLEDSGSASAPASENSAGHRRTRSHPIQSPVATLKRNHQEASSNLLARSSSAPVTTGIVEQSTRASKRKRLALNSSANHPQSSFENPTSSSVLNSTPPLLSATDITSYCLEIRPPPPPISTTDLTPASLPTESLQTLAQRMNLPSLFRPSKQARELRPMERGYWRVNWQLWSPELQKRSWSCLQNYVGKGGAGWGVWCTRDDDFRMFRVYCWGEIVGHIYLLLYTASEGKVKGTGACWIDGQGETVITMPA